MRAPFDINRHTLAAVELGWAQNLFMRLELVGSLHVYAQDTKPPRAAGEGFTAVLVLANGGAGPVLPMTHKRLKLPSVNGLPAVPVYCTLVWSAGLSRRLVEWCGSKELKAALALGDAELAPEPPRGFGARLFAFWQGLQRLVVKAQ